TYSQFMFGFKATGLEMDRKILAAIAFDDAAAFAEIVQAVKAVKDAG
ncbi:MAG TPA: 50S ribosomal protein L20, partial [Acidocella sp.]|nr:50S ribosomal protein L20 [Acidocella sp.]